MLRILSIVLLATAAAAAEPKRSAWTVRDHIPLEKFTVQAHRGAGVLAPENTLAAFELGWSLRCIPEADLRTTSDGVIVAFHDNNFSRVVVGIDEAMKKKGVKDITFAELEKLDVGEGRRVSRMTDIYALMRGKPGRALYLDIKNCDLEQLAREVKQAGVEKQVILASSKYEQDIRTWKKLVPEGQTLLWVGGTLEAQKEKFAEAQATGFADITQLQMHVHLPDGVTTIERSAVDPFRQPDAFLIACGDALRKHGVLYQTLPYGGQTKEVFLKLLDLGFMSFATDEPAPTWDAIRAFYEESKP